MKTKAAVMWESPGKFEITELELITKRYTLDQVNQGYDDMLEGKNIRGVLDIAH